MLCPLKVANYLPRVVWACGGGGEGICATSTDTVEPLMADIPFKRTPKSDPNCFFIQ